MNQLSEQIESDTPIDISPRPMPLPQGMESLTESEVLFDTEFGDISRITIRESNQYSILPSTRTGINEIFVVTSGTATLTSENTSKHISLGSIIVTEDLLSIIQLKTLEELTLLMFNIPIGLPKNQSEGKRVSIRSIVDEHFILSRGNFEAGIVSIPQNEAIYLDLECPNTEIFYTYVISGSVKFDTGKESKTFDTHTYYQISGDNMVTSHQALKDNTVLVQITFTSNSTLHMFQEEYKTKAEEISVKDGYTSDHCSRIEDLAVETGKQLKCSPEQLRNLSYAGFFHDLGKLKVPLEILQKEGKLTSEEWDIIKQHPTWGKEILLEETAIAVFIENTSAPATSIIEQHHERMDGSGYPFGLKGNEIHTEAYIIGVVDTYDAMTTDRPYRKGLSHEIAIAELQELKGTQFPNDVVDAFFVVINEARANDLTD